MSEVVTSKEELGKALKEEKDYIVIEGDLTKHVLRIKATGKVAWIVAGGAIAVAITIVVTTAGTGAPASSLVGGAAVGILGLDTTIAAISIGVAAGGIAGLNKLRKYKIVEKTPNRLILKRN